MLTIFNYVTKNKIKKFKVCINVKLNFYKYKKIGYNVFRSFTMRIDRKIVLYSLSGIILVGILVFGYFYFQREKDYESTNICLNDELVAKLIHENVNPFSKFKFIKQRNNDCNKLLKENKETVMYSKKEEYCKILDDSTVSTILLVNTYVNEMYDRESASKVLKETLPLMVPYNYCSSYMDNMINLIILKKKMGL